MLISTPTFDAPSSEIEYLAQVAIVDAVQTNLANNRIAGDRVGSICRSAREAIAGSKHYLQSARWAVQLAAAQAILAGGGSDLDIEMMALEARLRGLGETVEQLALKVIANSRIFTLVGAAVDGVERAANDAIAAYQGTDPAAYDGIVVTARETLRTELIAIIAPIQGGPTAQAMVEAILGPAPQPGPLPPGG